MNCQEAVEWMHRYIDHDLNEDEAALLMEHIRGCSSCDEEYELLQRLSAKLEQLPKVMPNYSLVDSILPQLDAIDEAKRMNDAVADRTDNVRTMTRSNRHSHTSSRRRLYINGALGLTAALILGVFIYKFEPVTIKDAEIALSTPVNQKATSSDSTAMNNSSNSENSLSMDNSNELSNQSSPVLTEQQDNNDANSNGDKKQAGNDGSSADQPRSEQSAAQPQHNSSSDKASNGTTNAGHSQASIGQMDHNQDVNDSFDSNIQGFSRDAPDASIGTGEEVNGLMDRDGSSPNDTPAIPDVNEGVMMKEGDPVHSDHNNMMGIARISDDSEWISPDGSYVIEMQNGSLLLYRNNLSVESAERELISETVIDGEWVTGQWLNAGLTFEYETAMDGVLTKHTISPK